MSLKIRTGSYCSSNGRQCGLVYRTVEQEAVARANTMYPRGESWAGYETASPSTQSLLTTWLSAMCHGSLTVFKG